LINSDLPRPPTTQALLALFSLFNVTPGNANLQGRLAPTHLSGRQGLVKNIRDLVREWELGPGGDLVFIETFQSTNFLCPNGVSLHIVLAWSDELHNSPTWLAESYGRRQVQGWGPAFGYTPIAVTIHTIEEVTTLALPALTSLLTGKTTHADPNQ